MQVRVCMLTVLKIISSVQTSRTSLMCYSKWSFCRNEVLKLIHIPKLVIHVKSRNREKLTGFNMVRYKKLQ